jgi:hypothetical protein
MLEWCSRCLGFSSRKIERGSHGVIACLHRNQKVIDIPHRYANICYKQHNDVAILSLAEGLYADIQEKNDIEFTRKKRSGLFQQQ